MLLPTCTIHRNCKCCVWLHLGLQAASWLLVALRFVNFSCFCYYRFT
jgi:hypothetical protein